MDGPPDRNVVKLIRDLQRRKARERRGRLIAEGRRLVEDALGSGARVIAVLASDSAAADPDVERLLGAAAARQATTEVVPRKEFDALADTETPSGVLAVVEWEPLSLDTLPAAPAQGVALVIDGVQDPGNVGTMIRTAHALGAWCTIALDGTADVRNPKVVRGAMGSTFRHPVAESSWEEFATWASGADIAILVSAADGATVSHAHPAPRPSALVVGSEGRGVRAEWSGLEHRRIAIPMPGGAESLNAAVAAGILLHELLRGR
jgi:RNA methyltransferase, TrmH family